MESQTSAPGGRDTFRPRKTTGKLRAWEWSEDARVLIRERLNASGGLGFRVVFPRSVTGGRELFIQSRDFETAQGIARTRGREFQNSRSTARLLSDGAKIQAATALRLLRQHGKEAALDAIAREYVEATEILAPSGLLLTAAARALAEALAVAAPTGKSLRELVEYAARRLTPSGGNRTLAEVAGEMIALKETWHASGELRSVSLRDFRARASRIARDIGGFPLPELTKDILIEWLRGAGASPRTKKNYRMVLTELLRYAVQKRYLVDNPLAEFTRQDVKELEGRGASTRQPGILTPTEAERLLVAAYAHPELDLGAAVTLALFCGIRTEELKRLSWDAVRLDESAPFVVIGAEIAKKRRIRNVDIPPNAVAWLKLWTRGAKVTRSAHANDYQKRFMRLQRLAGFGSLDATGAWVSSWEGNAMRHSYGSYHYALHGNPIETARLLGHKADDSVLFAHYRALAAREQGAAYFGIWPAKKHEK